VKPTKAPPARRFLLELAGRVAEGVEGVVMVTDATKQVIPFDAKDAGRVGEGCFYLDVIVWLNGDRIQLGDRVSFGYGCYVNGYGGR
jgi:hypothetical protein